MDANLQEILNNLEEKEPRSRLVPYRNLILELRRRNRTYREILQILADHCQIRVSISTLHDFLRAQRRKELTVKRDKMKEGNSQDLNEKAHRPTKDTKDAIENGDVQQRIAVLKQREISTHTNALYFSYDPTQPLHLPANMNSNKTEE